jgi:hypothetical protein
LSKFVRKGVEQHLVLVQERAYFYSLFFFAILLTIICTLKNKGASCIYYKRLHPQRHARTHQLEENENKFKLRPYIQDIIPQLPSYSGEFDPKT